MNAQASGKVETHVNAAAAALDAARALGHALGESHAYLDFEAAYHRFDTDEDLQRRLSDFRSRQRGVQAALWGGADPAEQKALEQEWQALCVMPPLRAYLRAQEELATVVRGSVRMISDAVGVDYGAICAPAGGCC